MAKIDGRYILVEKEDLTFDVDVTQQPVERSIDITDHVQRKARSLSISGLVVNDLSRGHSAAEIHRYLVECQDKGKIVNFTGRTAMHGLLSGLSTSRDYTVSDGFTFSVTITEVLIANAAKAAVLPVQLKSQVQEVKAAGLKQPKESKKVPSTTVTPKKTKTPKTVSSHVHYKRRNGNLWEESD